MKEYIIKVNKNKLISPDIKLVQNDYNSTKLIFEFDFEEDYAKVFQMKYPSGDSWIKEIINNELVLADENNTEIVPVLVENGLYEFDIAIYDGNSKLTTTDKAYLTVRSEIKGEDVELDDRTPILDDLINRVENLGSGGKVDDVLVDGVSVVENKIANISLASLERTLQDILAIIQGGELNENQVSEIEQLIVSYFENKTVEEVEK